MSSPSLVLITGGNGFVGYAVLVGLLKEGVCLFRYNTEGRRSFSGSFLLESSKLAQSSMMTLTLLICSPCSTMSEQQSAAKMPSTQSLEVLQSKGIYPAEP